jgi:hypothetical protein
VLIASPWLTPCTASNNVSNVVDIFDATTGTWSTAALSVARGDLAATSLPNAGLAMFAGGFGTCLLCLVELMLDALVCEGGMREWEEGAVLIASPWITPCTANNNYPSNIVDIFDATAGTWHTAALSVARGGLAATSLPNAGLAFFACGLGTCLLFLFELMRDAMVCEGGCVSGMRALR